MNREKINYTSEIRYYQPMTPVVKWSDELSADINHNHGVVKKGMIFEDDHIHLDRIEIYVHIEGDVSFAVNGSVYVPAPGNILLSLPGEPHHCIYNCEGTVENYCMWIEPSENLKKKLSFLSMSAKKISNLIVPSEDDEKTLIRHLEDFFNAKISGKFDSIASLAAVFGILDIVNKAQIHALPPKEVPKNLAGILDFIEQNYLSSINVDMISKAFFINRTTLTRWFNVYLDTTPAKYIESKRFSHAIGLLRHGASVQYTASHSGFNGCSHFISEFRKKFGITPYKYTKALGITDNTEEFEQSEE